jgi:hypothetical protein
MPVIPVETPVVANGMSIRLVSGSVSAGFPSPAADDLEDELDPISWVVRHPSSTFWWRVEGEDGLLEVYPAQSADVPETPGLVLSEAMVVANDRDLAAIWQMAF